MMAYWWMLVIPLLGGLLALMVKPNQVKLLQLLLTVSGGYLFATTILHLLPENLHDGNTLAKLFVLIGFFLQMILEKMSEGVEHGHLHFDAPYGHDHGHDHSHYHKKGGLLTFGILFSLGIHSFIEGIPINGPFATDSNLLTNHLFMGVVLHKFPTAFAMITVIKQATKNNYQNLILLGVYMIMTPVGMMVGKFLYSSNPETNTVFQLFSAAAAGSFLHISTTIFFESTHNHNLNVTKLIAAFLGAILVLLT